MYIVVDIYNNYKCVYIDNCIYRFTIICMYFMNASCTHTHTCACLHAHCNIEDSRVICCPLGRPIETHHHLDDQQTFAFWVMPLSTDAGPAGTLSKYHRQLVPRPRESCMPSCNHVMVSVLFLCICIGSDPDRWIRHVHSTKRALT